MAYDVELAERLREALARVQGISERRMFGGLGFLAHGKLAVSASGQGGLLVRVRPGEAGALLGEPGAAPCVMRGREMAGWLRVDAAGLAGEDDLARWVARGVAAARGG